MENNGGVSFVRWQLVTTFVLTNPNWHILHFNDVISIYVTRKTDFDYIYKVKEKINTSPINQITIHFLEEGKLKIVIIIARVSLFIKDKTRVSKLKVIEEIV